MDKWLRNSPTWLAWENGLNVDGDGAPNCYGPNGGLDYLANAGHPGDWFGIITDPQGNPVIQGPNDPCPGFYVSDTALHDPTKPHTSPLAYVNSSIIPYISVPSNAIRDFSVRLGDVGFVFCRLTGRFSSAVVADVGPRNKWGEGSIALAEALGLPSSPKNGGIPNGIVICVFKRTAHGWPRSNKDIAQQVQNCLNSLGGTNFYNNLIKPVQSQSFRK